MGRLSNLQSILRAIVGDIDQWMNEVIVKNCFELSDPKANTSH